MCLCRCWLLWSVLILQIIFFVISKEMHKSEYLIKFAFPFSSKLISLRLVRTCKLQVLTSQREMTWDMKKLFLWAKLNLSGSLGKRMKPQEKPFLCRAWVSTGAAGARHPPKFWTSPLAPADFEVLNTNWHPQSSFYVTSGNLSFKFLTQALYGEMQNGYRPSSVDQESWNFYSLE